MKKVSVIIPTYNRADNIERAINSVINQTYENLEIIVVDDNPNDSECRIKMIDIMSRYSNNKKVKYLKHEFNKNGAAARNTGIKESTGDYITFLDDDDYYMPDRIEKLVFCLEKSSYGGAYTGFAIVKNKQIINIKEATKFGKLDDDLLRQYSFFGTGSNMFIRSSIVKSLKGFDETFNRNQDLEFMIRFFQKNEIINIPEILVVKNIDDQSNSNSFKKQLDSRISFLNKFKEIIDSRTKKIRNQIYATNFLNLINYSFKSDDVKTNYTMCKNKMKNYNIHLTLKNKLMIIAYYINSKLKLKKIFYDKNANIRVKKDIHYVEIIEFVNKIENN